MKKITILLVICCAAVWLAACGKRAITEEQAYKAVQNYCFKKNPDLERMVGSDIYFYWTVDTTEDNVIVVTFRSYTASREYYYINPKSGKTYVTEVIPGEIDEKPTGERFNIRDYMD